MSINLLSKDLRSTGKIAEAASVLRKLLMAGLFLLILGLLGTFYYLARLNSERNKIASTNTSLSTQVTNLESAEQRLYLLKDRLAQAKAAMEENTASDNVANFDQMRAKTGEDVGFTEVDIQRDELEVVMEANNSAELGRFVEDIIDGKLFNGLVLNNVSYSERVGYEFSLTGSTAIPKKTIEQENE